MCDNNQNTQSEELLDQIAEANKDKPEQGGGCCGCCGG